MTRLTRDSLLLLLLASLASCSGWLPPYETVPAKAHRGATNTGTRIGVCYNTLTTTAEQVRVIAMQSCDPGSVPHPVERDLSLDNCPLFQPARATFVCTAP